MLGFFLDALQLGLPLTLTWMALWAGAARGGRVRISFAVASGTGAAAALLSTVLRQATGVVNRELVSMALLPVSILLAVAGLVWLWRGPADTRPRWGGSVLAGLAGVITALQLPEVMLLTAGLTVPGASVFTSEVVLNLGGYLAGIGLAVVIAWTVFGAGRGAGARAVRISLTAVLGITLLSQLSILARILLARRLIGLPRWGFQALAWTATHEWVFTVALVVACLTPVVAARVAQRRPLPPPATPAEGRLRRAAVLSRRRFVVAAGASLVTAAVAMTLGRAIADAEPELSPPEPIGSDEAEVWVELASIDDGHLHRHSYLAADGTEVRFITIRKSASAFVACLDACEICGPSGYFERDGHVICKLCDVAMNIATIGFKGGCNPIPIDFTVTGGRLVIARQVLEDSTPVFA